MSKRHFSGSLSLRPLSRYLPTRKARNRPIGPEKGFLWGVVGLGEEGRA